MRLYVHTPYAVLLFSCIASTTPTTTLTTTTTTTVNTTTTRTKPKTPNVDTTDDIAQVDQNVRFPSGLMGNRDEIFNGNNSTISDGATSESSRLGKTETETAAEKEGKTLPHWGLDVDGETLQLGEDEEGHQIKQRDIDDAVDAGLKMMNELHFVKEPLLYSMGLYLDESEAAGRVASFSTPTVRALHQARYGYAALQASLRIREKYPESRSRRDPAHVSFLRTDAFDDQCPLRGNPRCPSASRRYRTADGTCNNLEFPWKGASMLPMQRFLLPDYDDEVQAIRRAVRSGARLPSPREISIRIHRDRDVEMPSVTMMFVQWGQFVDHDITSTAQSRAFNASIPRCCARGGAGFLPPEFMHPECLPIEVPEDDWFLGRMGMRCIEFVRSAPSSRINCDLGWREQINQVTSYIDASTVYGSDSERADSLRIFRNGLLQYGRPRRQSQTPPDPPGGELCRLGALSTECFKGGDMRVGEQPGLTAFHTVWLRYHNRIAAILANLNPHWSDEKNYQETRRIIGALIQHITYKEFLPIVLGHEVMDLFDLNVERKGYFNLYDPLVNPAPANAFSSAAFRFGHSLVQHSFLRSDSKHRLLVNNVSIHEELNNHENIWSFGSVDRLILGFCNQPSQRRDEFISSELTHHLFQQPGQPFGMDLAAVNIQRGRDHGIPGYTAWREPCGLSPIRAWADLEPLMNFETIQRFRSLYDHVDDIDLYPGGLAERPIRGGIVGPTFGCIIAQQFANLRKGDRFWYENGGFENSFTPAQLQQIRRVTFGQVLCQVLPEIESVQPFVFLSPDNFRNNRFSCDSPEMESLDLRAWEERRLAQSQQGRPPPPPPVASIQSAAPTLANNNAAPKVGVNGKLEDLEAKVEFINGNRPGGRPQTHLAQKVDSKLDFSDGIKVNDKLTLPDQIEINDNLDFSSEGNSSKGNRNKNKNKLQQKPTKGVNDNIDFDKNSNKSKISDKLRATTTKKSTDVVDFDVIFLSGTNKNNKKVKENKDIDFDDMFDLPVNHTEEVKVIKRSVKDLDDDQDERESYEVDEFLEDLMHNQNADAGRKQSAATKKRRKKPAKARPTAIPKTTTKRNTVYFQNRPMISDFYNPLKIKVTNITTSTIDLGSDDDDRPPFSLKPQLHTSLYPEKPTFSLSSSNTNNPNPDKTKPVTFYHTTRRPLTYDQDEYYVLHPTINKPNRYKQTNYGTVQKIQAATTDLPKSPDYQVNINIHLVSSTPKADIVISDKLSNPNVHIVDGSHVNYEPIKPSNGYYQYSTKRPAPNFPVRTTTQRPDYYRPRPTLTPTSQSYYYRPTTHNYDRFEDRPFSTSKRPYIYRPSESFLAMFEEMHQNKYGPSQYGQSQYGQSQYGQSLSTRPTYVSSYVDKVTKRPTIPSYLYYDGKYFNEKGQSQSQFGQQGGNRPSYMQTDSYYINHAVQNGGHSASSGYDSGEKNFVKISSVLGNTYLHNADKEHYIHTAQQKESESDVDSVENVTVANDRVDSDKQDALDIEQRAAEDAQINLDAEPVNIDADDTDGKLQIDIIPRESRHDDWVIYEPDADIAVMDEPEINPLGEHVADELPKPLSEFWKKRADDDGARDNADETDTGGLDKLGNKTRTL